MKVTSFGNIDFYHLKRHRIFIQHNYDDLLYIGFEKRWFNNNINKKDTEKLFSVLPNIIKRMYGVKTITIYPHSHDVRKEYARLLCGIGDEIFKDFSLLEVNGLFVISSELKEGDALEFNFDYGELIKLNKTYKSKLKEVSTLCPN